MKIKDQQLSQQQAGELWTDIRAYFIELFEEREDLEAIVIPPADLKSDLEARFKKKYDVDAILKLLENGFTQADGHYRFNRADFIHELPVREINETPAPVEAAVPVEQEDQP